jgi:2',3'-cyclic-nucleotide 2'-phosphodiesterase (5'-nucleotidase family)
MRILFSLTFFCTLLYSCCSLPVQSGIGSEQIAVNGVSADRQMERAIRPYRRGAEQKLSQELVYCDKPLIKALPESELSNMMADAVLEASRIWASAEAGRPSAHFCLLNYGGIRSALPAGMITLGNLYELMPFENELVLVRLSSADLKLLFEYLRDKKGGPLAGVRVRVDKDGIVQVYLGDDSFSFERDLWVATSDFLAGGGDGMYFLTKPLALMETRIKIRDAIGIYFSGLKAKGETLNPKLDGRVVIE